MFKPLFINGLSSITPQPLAENGFLSEELSESPKQFLQIIAPDYKEYIPPVQLRRMAKLMRMGFVGAQQSMQDAKLDQVDAIIVATGHGNIGDTEKFLNAIIDNQERMLVPTSFVQSTHNIVSGSIALKQGNKNYNMTYTHHNSAFEMALLDALIHNQEGIFHSFLIGALDEITEENYQIKAPANLWREEAINPLNIFKQPVHGACLPGESAVFFNLATSASDHSYAKVLDVEMFYKADSIEIKNIVSDFLLRNNLSLLDIDIIMGGFNGDEDFDLPQVNLLEDLFPKAALLAYKQFVGEHPTSSAFALWMAAQILSGKNIPKSCWYKSKTQELDKIENILLWQKGYLTGGDYALVLVSKV